MQPPFGGAELGKSLAVVSADQPESWFDWLAAHRCFPAPRFTGTVDLAVDCLLNVCGATWLELRPHLLLQHLPVPALGQCRVDFARSSSHQLKLELPAGQTLAAADRVERLALNLELPPPKRAAHWLAHLRGHQLILDPEPARVLLLRALGLPAWWLDAEADPNGWLQQPQALDSHQWSAHLG